MDSLPSCILMSKTTCEIFVLHVKIKMLVGNNLKAIPNAKISTETETLTSNTVLQHYHEMGLDVTLKRRIFFS